MMERPQPLTNADTAHVLLDQLYQATLAALKAADRPGTHIQKTNTLKIAAASLYATLRRTAKHLGRIPPPRFLRYR